MRVPIGLRTLAYLLSAIYLLFGVLAPIVRIFIENGFQLSSFFSPITLQIVRTTLFQATLSTGLAAGIGLFTALIFGRTRAAQSLFQIPFAMPSVVVANAALFFLGSRGLGISYSLRAVIFTHVWINAPWIALILTETLGQIPEIQYQASRTLGAGRFERFRTITWHYLKWTLASGSIQVFSFCAASFGIVLLLGGGPPVDTLETAIYSSLRFGSLNLGEASSLAIWQLVIGFVPLVCLSFFSARRKGVLEVTETTHKPVSSPGPFNRAKVLIPLIFIAPFLTSIFYFRLDLNLFREMLIPTATSIFLSLSVAALCMVFTSSLFLVSKTKTQFLAQIPAATSALILGLGFWLTYSRWIDPFEGSFFAVIFIQAVLFVPLAYRMLWPEIQNSQSRALEAALSLGASPMKAFFTVEWPRLNSPFISSFSVIAGLSVGEVAIASLFQSERVKPLSVWMAEQMTRYRFEEAQMGALVLMFLSIMLSFRKSRLK